MRILLLYSELDVTASHHSSSPFSAVVSFWRNAELVWQLSKRELTGRYKGSYLGLCWALVNPLLLLAVYTFVFSVVFEVRWARGGDEHQFQFALILFSGLIVHGMIAEILGKGPALILQNTNYVKKVVFPLEVLPLVITITALFHACISYGLLVVALALLNGSVHGTALLLPVVLLPFLAFLLGVGWLLASFGVFFRDISQLTGLIATVLLFVSPIFFPLDALPEAFRPLFLANPLTFVIEQSRGLLIWGTGPDWRALGFYYLLAFAVAWAGFYAFQRMRKGFADVI